MTSNANDETGIVVQRVHSWQNRFRKFSILVDGNRVGTVADSDRTYVPVSPGHHTLQVVLSERYKTGILDAELHTGEQLKAKCGPGNKFPSMSQVWQGQFDPDKYIGLTLDEADAID
jgi:hypothetical protein